MGNVRVICRTIALKNDVQSGKRSEKLYGQLSSEPKLFSTGFKALKNNTFVQDLRQLSTGNVDKNKVIHKGKLSYQQICGKLQKLSTENGYINKKFSNTKQNKKRWKR